MHKSFSVFVILCLLSIAGFAQTNAKSPVATAKVPNKTVSTTANQRSIKPSNKPLSVKPTNSQPKEEIVEEITIVRTPRRPMIQRSEQGKTPASKPTTNTKPTASAGNAVNISKTVSMPEE